MNPIIKESCQKKVPKKLRACCACKPTKKLRDDCIMTNGAEKCEDFIEAHKECLRSKGFKVL